MWSSQFSWHFIRSCDFLLEHLAVPVVSESQEADEADFELWRNLFDSGAEKLFERRLASLGLTEDQARCAVRPTAEQDQRFLRGMNSSKRPPGTIPATDGSPNSFPFSPLWWPFVALRKRRGFPVSGESLVTELRRIRSAGDSTCCRTSANSPLSRLTELFAKERAGGSSFQDFVRTTRALEYRNLFESYPALARCYRDTGLKLDSNDDDFPLPSA